MSPAAIIYRPGSVISEKSSTLSLPMGASMSFMLFSSTIFPVSVSISLNVLGFTSEMIAVLTLPGWYPLWE
jgi:hypothetical protein